MESAIKTLVKTLTQPKFVQDYAKPILGRKCFGSLVEKVDLKDVDCLKLALSKLIGFGIVLGGGLVKVPQIVKIMEASSADGLSLSSYVLESLSYGVSLCYNVRKGNPFSTFGETFFVFIQNILIMMLMFSYQNSNYKSALILVMFLALVYALNSQHLVADEMLSYFQAATIPISLFSKLPQILVNFSRGSTGQLSAFTVLMFFLGSVARVFTTWQKVKDPLILWGFVLASILNAILVIQMVLYWNSGKPATSTTAKDKGTKRRKIE